MSACSLSEEVLRDSLVRADEEEADEGGGCVGQDNCCTRCRLGESGLG